MGTWGIGILANDFSLDVYGDFLESYDDGDELVDIHDDMVEAAEDLDEEDTVEFWLGLAQAEWECGYQNAETYEQVRRIIVSKLGLAKWHGAEDERQAVLLEFLECLSKPVAEPRQRQEKVPEQPVYLEGTCLAVKLYVGGYGAVIVLRNVAHNDYVHSLLGGLKGVFQVPPCMEVFEKREWLKLTHHNFRGNLHLTWAGQQDLLENADKVVVVGQTTIRESDPNAELIWQKFNSLPLPAKGSPFVDSYGLNVGFAGISWMENQIWKQDEWDRKNPR